ncbi:alpha/beta hydrolase [Sediminibacillus albus]|uniref:S-formylglutathione hydrolase FrmB n=1 Tax=Sediminibacillus albus TaxID=407036 RepID=A0A1G9CAG9_9BACI|nr:alpha/beta hydrolase family protein [Sediminibacillus albus]SDK48414.1 S-formylglutathione hydrolase FrmB [Sediminibacillus albus]
MALLRCEFFSDTLRLSTSMTVILPEQTNHQIGMKNKKSLSAYPTLYLLHGFSDNDSIWTRRTSLERFAADYGIAVVMPNADHSYYADMRYGKRYWTFLTEELPDVASSFFRLSDKREDTFVAGLSMGGYGALKWALNYPDKFAAAASLSGVTDMVTHLQNARQTQQAFSAPLSLVFGEDDIKGSYEDLLWLLEKNKNRAGPKPMLYQACGTEDFLYPQNLTFMEKCRQTDLELTADFGPGDHNWNYWDQQIKKVLEWLPVNR